MAKEPIEKLDAAKEADALGTASTAPETASPVRDAPDENGADRRCIRVTALVPFRRAGFGFGPEPLTIPRHEISDEQLGLLLAETRLTVETSTNGDAAMNETMCLSSFASCFLYTSSEGFPMSASNSPVFKTG